MSIKSVSLEASTAEERRAFARDFLNLDLAGDASDDDVSSAIARAQPGSTMIFVQETAPTTEEASAPIDNAAPLSPEQEALRANLKLRPEEVGRPGAGSLGRGDPRAKIEIPVIETEDDTGAQDVFVGVNGRAWQLKRGVELVVPYRVVEALDHAIATQVTHKEDPSRPGEVDVIVRDAKRITYQRIEMPTQAEIDRWHEETDALFCA